MTKLYKPSYDDIHRACTGLAHQIELYGVKFDAIVGISRGGLVPANALSHQLNIPLIPVCYSSKAGNGDNRDHSNTLPTIDDKTILILDDICDSGHTLKELADHYHKGMANRVYTGCIYYKLRKDPVIVTNFSWVTVAEDSPWVIFPWEQ